MLTGFSCACQTLSSLTGEAGQEAEIAQPVTAGKSRERTLQLHSKPCTRLVPVFPCWILPAENQHGRSPELFQ